MPKTAKALASEIQGIWDAADRENRGLSASEREYVEQLVDECESQHALEQKMSVLDGVLPSGVFRANGGSTLRGGPGDVFVKSEGYLKVKDPASRGQTWTTGPIEVSSSPLRAKGTLLEPGAGGPGGGLVPPFYEPGIVTTLFEPLGVADVFGSSQTTASQVRYVNEGTADNEAAGVAEGGTKPESTLALSEVVEPIKKIATVLPISDELLEDGPSVQSYINSRLSLFVSLEEERQLLRGNGTNELVGLFNRAGAQAINTYTAGTADNNAVALLKVLNNTRGSSFLEPDTIIMHTSNWLATRLLTDANDQFYGGGPFTSAYGGPQGPSNAFVDTLWNKRVILSNVVGAGTALVGAFQQGAHIWRRSGVTVEATNSHADYFVHNLNMVRAEERLGLGLYRPSAFTAVSGLD